MKLVAFVGCLMLAFGAVGATIQLGEPGWTGSLLVEMGRRGHKVTVVIPGVSVLLGPGKHYTTRTFLVPYGKQQLDELQARNAEVMESKQLPLLEKISTRIKAYLAAKACPNPPSYIPRFFTNNSDYMSFRQRVLNVLVSIVEPLLCRLIYWSTEDVASRLQRYVSVAEILRSGALWLFLYDFSLEFPKPLMPNMVLIGGINCAVKNPLTEVSAKRMLYLCVCFGFTA
uniref:UDP glucuronosyltransferase 1 family, polypeptide B7 n=1 Tax=Sinocyclocheilus grahami TaxID=75366 RepID=A0A672M8S1_SINGR